MTPCAKCGERDATFHFAFSFPGKTEKVDLCEQCAALAGHGKPNLAQIANRTITGKRCDFCGRDAVTGIGELEGEMPTYFCIACKMEQSLILQQLFRTEAPELIERMAEGESHFDRMFDSELKAKIIALGDKATRLLRERRKQDGRDKDR